MLRIEAPSAADLAVFHQDGYLAYPDILTDAGREGLIDEIVHYAPVQAFLSLSGEQRAKQTNSSQYFVRPWNDRGAWSDQLIDAPLVTALLQATIGGAWHFCHSAMNVAARGAPGGSLHMDHHHWFHDNPVNLAERDNWYIQVLYYPNGFRRGDRGLSIVPGSHRVAPTPEVTPERLLAGDFDREAGRELKLQQLELPPGSMIYLNARTFHGVAAKPPDSPQEYRVFAIDIFKQAGPPHRHTQEIPPEWLARATPQRRRIFLREAYTAASWNS
jgi:hypothetical protein